MSLDFIILITSSHDPHFSCCFALTTSHCLFFSGPIISGAPPPWSLSTKELKTPNLRQARCLRNYIYCSPAFCETTKDNRYGDQFIGSWDDALHSARGTQPYYKIAHLHRPLSSLPSTPCPPRWSPRLT